MLKFFGKGFADVNSISSFKHQLTSLDGRFVAGVGDRFLSSQHEHVVLLIETKIIHAFAG